MRSSMKRMDGSGEGSGENTGGGWRRGSVRRSDSSRGSNLNEDGSSAHEMVRVFEVQLLAQRVSLLHDGHERKLIGRHVFGCPHTYTYYDMRGGCLI